MGQLDFSNCAELLQDVNGQYSDSSLLISDLQHPIVGAVPLSEGPQGSGPAVQRGELRVSSQTGADHGRPEQDALPEGRH